MLKRGKVFESKLDIFTRHSIIYYHCSKSNSEEQKRINDIVRSLAYKEKE